jgi:hypothetical protein
MEMDTNTAQLFVIIGLVIGLVSLLLIVIGLFGGRRKAAWRMPDLWPPAFFFQQPGDANFMDARHPSEDDAKYETARFIDTNQLRRQVDETNPNKTG